MTKLDLIIKNATLPDGRENIDILCSDGYIVDIGTNIEADTNKVFIKNIFQLPIKEKFKVYFVDIQSKQILYEKEIITNMTNEVEIDKKFLKPNIFLFTKKYIGVPMYVSFKNYNISFEHTHPPHEYVLSDDRYKRVSDLKKEINEIIV